MQEIAKHIIETAITVQTTPKPARTRLTQEPLKPCTRHFPVLLRTTRCAQSTSQYYFVLQDVHKILPSTTLCYKTFTNYFQYYFVLKDIHKAHPSTTSYYKICTKHIPVLLCATRRSQITSQYYFELQDLHKLFPSTTLY